MNKQYFFLSGIARSGSTILGSILNQNPDIYVSPTSPLMDYFCLNEQTLLRFTTQYTFDFEQISRTMDRNLARLYYDHIQKPYIIDKHRGWPRNIEIVKKTITEHPKVICTHRPICENIVSFLKLIRNDPDNSVDRELKQRGMKLDTHNRAMHLWKEYSSDPYDSMKHGLQHNRDCIHVVNYHALVKNPETEINKIYDFLEIPHFKHTFTNVRNTCSEKKDDMWGFKGLHDIRGDMTVTSDDPAEVLGPALMKYFRQFDEELNL